MSTFKSTEWSISDLYKSWDIISSLAHEQYELDYFEPQFEILSEESMLRAYSTHGLPTMYDHWSFGKSYLNHEKEYKRGSPLAMEMIINSDPPVCYLMNSNSLMIMLQVMAHAAVGHASFFKNNYLFKQWTQPQCILPFANYAKKYIKECEDKYGIFKVEQLINTLHAVSNIGYSKISELKNLKEEKKEIKIENDQKSVNYLFQWIDEFFKKDKSETIPLRDHIIEYDSIYDAFIDHAGLPEWQINIIKIFKYINQYFYPQINTKMMNEGWATFWDRQICRDLYENSVIDNPMMMEHICISGAVTAQSPISYFKRDQNGNKDRAVNKYYSGINPYHIGNLFFEEIKRVCEDQDKESLQWVPTLRNRNWLDAFKWAYSEFKDDNFCYQFLTPRLARKLKLAIVQESEYRIKSHGLEAIENVLKFTHTHNDEDFEMIRQKLSTSYNLFSHTPTVKIVVDNGHPNADRITPRLNLIYTPYKGMLLESHDLKKVLTMLRTLWRGEVSLRKKESMSL